MQTALSIAKKEMRGDVARAEGEGPDETTSQQYTGPSPCIEKGRLLLRCRLGSPKSRLLQLPCRQFFRKYETKTKAHVHVLSYTISRSGRITAQDNGASYNKLDLRYE